MAGDRAEDQVTGKDYSSFTLPSTEKDDVPVTPLTAEEKRRHAEVEMRRAAATSGKGAPPTAIDAYRQKQNMNGFKVASGPIVDTPFAPPIDLDPRYVEALEGFEDHKGYLATTQTAFSTAYEGLKQIAAGRAQALKNQAWNEWQVLINVGGFAEKMHIKMAAAFDSATNALTQGIAHIEKELTSPIENAAASPFAREIRDHVKSLPDDKRSEFLAVAIRDGDQRVVDALLGSPHYLSGLPKSVHDNQLYMLRKKQKPELVGRQAAMRAALNLIEQRAPSIHSHVQSAMGGKFSTLQRVRAANSAAEKALAFEQGTNNPLA